MSPDSPIIISFPLGLFSNATMNVPNTPPSEEPLTDLAINRELLDMPNIIPETEGADQFFYFDET